eukprot:Clim_evm54s128 gene=Clim_evmTU54s128
MEQISAGCICTNRQHQVLGLDPVGAVDALIENLDLSSGDNDESKAIPKDLKSEAGIQAWREMCRRQVLELKMLKTELNQAMRQRDSALHGLCQQQIIAATVSRELRYCREQKGSHAEDASLAQEVLAAKRWAQFQSLRKEGRDGNVLSADGLAEDEQNQQDSVSQGIGALSLGLRSEAVSEMVTVTTTDPNALKHCRSYVTRTLLGKVAERIEAQHALLVEFFMDDNTYDTEMEAEHSDAVMSNDGPDGIDTGSLSTVVNRSLQRYHRSLRDCQRSHSAVEHESVLEVAHLARAVLALRRFKITAVDGQLKPANAAHFAYLRARADALVAKYRTLLAELRWETYGADPAIAESLRAIAGVLEHLHAEEDAALHTLTRSMDVYANAGLGFDELVQEYAKVKEDLDDRAWAMRELRT